MEILLPQDPEERRSIETGLATKGIKFIMVETEGHMRALLFTGQSHSGAAQALLRAHPCSHFIGAGFIKGDGAIWNSPTCKDIFGADQPPQTNEQEKKHADGLLEELVKGIKGLGLGAGASGPE